MYNLLQTPPTRLQGRRSPTAIRGACRGRVTQKCPGNEPEVPHMSVNNMRCIAVLTPWNFEL